MSSYTIQSIQGIGYRVVSDQGKVVGTFDDEEEAEEHKDKLVSGLLKEHELWEN